MLFAVILLPATMLGCVYYPWAALHNIRWLQIAVLINPMVYMSEGLRAVLTPVLPHMPKTSGPRGPRGLPSAPGPRPGEAGCVGAGIPLRGPVLLGLDVD